MSWSTHADKVLAQLFSFGKPAPTKQELFDAYPFCERAYWPYKVWLRRVRAWKAAHARGMSAPAVPTPDQARRAKVERDDTETLPLL